jgi:voltage-gated potassium channel
MTHTSRMQPAPDMLKVFTGVSSQQIVDAVRALIEKRGEFEATLIERLMQYPMETLAGFLLGTSAAFYLAEREVNPKVKTFVDALYYISTCLSVGYADIFAQTQTGRAIATLVMTVGPSLTGELLDPPHKAASASSVNQDMMIERLDAILAELRARP